MNFGNIIIAFVLLSLIVTGLVIWIGHRHGKGKLLDEAQVKLKAYCQGLGSAESATSRAYSILRNIAAESKANAGQINALDASAPGIRLAIARHLDMAELQMMALARTMNLKTDDVLNALANLNEGDYLQATRIRTESYGKADLPRELDESEQEQVIGGRTIDSMPEAADAALEAAAAGETVQPWAEGNEYPHGTRVIDGEIEMVSREDKLASPVSYEYETPPAGMKRIFINLQTKRFASRAFAEANPDQVEARLVPALN